MPILKPSYADAIQVFAIERAASMLTSADDVHPSRWTQSRYSNIDDYCRRNNILHLPAALSRGDIFETSRPDNPDVYRTFLWSMMWGYQSEGTGAYRTNVALDPHTVPTVEERLANMFEAAQTGQLERAFDLMRGRGSRVRNVNTAFGSKFFYFAGFDPLADSEVQPLILDRRVVSALREVLTDISELPSDFADLTLCCFQDYEWYLRVARRIRDELISSYRIDVVEFFLWSVA